MGLIREQSGIGPNILNQFDVDLHGALGQVDSLAKSGAEDVTSSNLSLTPRANMAIERAIREVRRKNHDHIGTEHLLLGLLCDSNNAVTAVLIGLGVSSESMLHSLMDVLGTESPTEA